MRDFRNNYQNDKYSVNNVSFVCRWFFNKEKDIKKISAPQRWNFAICFETQTTREYNWEERVNSWVLYMPTWPRWQDGNDWVSIQKTEIVEWKLYITYSNWNTEEVWYVKWEDGKSVSSFDVASLLKSDKDFLSMVKWQDWKDGKDWISPSIDEIVNKLKNDEEFITKIKPRDWKDAVVDYDIIVEKIKSDTMFVNKIKWEPWKDWETPIIDYDVIIQDIKKDKKFIEKIKWEPGKDWTTPSVASIIEMLKNDEEFIQKTKWKDWITPKITAKDVAEELKKDELFVESIRWKDWVWFQWPPWKDWESVTIWFSPDWETNITAEYKPWDKFMHVRLGNRKPNVFQIIP